MSQFIWTLKNLIATYIDVTLGKGRIKEWIKTVIRWSGV